MIRILLKRFAGVLHQTAIQIMEKGWVFWRGTTFQPNPTYWEMIPISIETAMKQKRK